MNGKRIPAVAIVALAVSVLALASSRVIHAQDTGPAKYKLRVPNGLAFAEF